MGLQNIQRSQVIETVTYSYDFMRDKTSGCGFPCDEQGNIKFEEMAQPAIDNYNYCKAHPEEYKEVGVQRNVHRYKEPAHGTCSCGREVELSVTRGWEWYGIDCECGKIYNQLGQELKPRSEWEERIDDDDY